MIFDKLDPGDFVFAYVAVFFAIMHIQLLYFAVQLMWAFVAKKEFECTDEKVATMGVILATTALSAFITLVSFFVKTFS